MLRPVLMRHRSSKTDVIVAWDDGGKGQGGVGVPVADQPEGPFRELTKEKLVRGRDPTFFADDGGRFWI